MFKKRQFLEGMIVGIVLIIFVNSVSGFLLPRLGSSFGERDIAFDKKLETIQRLIDTYYVDDFDQSDLEEGIYLGMVYGLGDRYSSYMDTATYQSFWEQTEGSYAGVGAAVQSYSYGGVLIINPYKGAPAYEAGIRAGDVITKVDGTDVTSLDLDVAVSMMKGEPGTAVTLTVYRDSESRTFDVDIERAQIDIPTVEYKMLEDNIGYVLLTGFDGVTYDQFVTAIEELKVQGMEGIIIDVRNNPGGRLDIVADICELLVPEGVTVYTEDKNGDRAYYYSNKDYLDLPMALLVNENSASASEVLSGAIKDYGVGSLVGNQTFGKGVVQSIFPLSDGSAVKITTARYYSPNGICIHGEGITPDYIVPMDEEDTYRLTELTYEEDVQLQKAVEVVQEKMLSK